MGSPPRPNHPREAVRGIALLVGLALGILGAAAAIAAAMVQLVG